MPKTLSEWREPSKCLCWPLLPVYGRHIQLSLLYFRSENILWSPTFALLSQKKKLSHQKFWLRATKGLKCFSLGMKENHRGTRSAHFYNSANLMVRNFKSTFKFLVQDFKVEDKGNLSKPRNNQDLKRCLTFCSECFNYEVTDYFKFIWMWVIYYHII